MHLAAVTFLAAKLCHQPLRYLSAPAAAPSAGYQRHWAELDFKPTLSWWQYVFTLLLSAMLCFPGEYRQYLGVRTEITTAIS